MSARLSRSVAAVRLAAVLSLAFAQDAAAQPSDPMKESADTQRLPVVTRVAPSTVRVNAGGDPVVVTVEGTHMKRLGRPLARRQGAVATNVYVRWHGGSSENRQLLVGAERNAIAGTYAIISSVSGDARMILPLKVEVAVEPTADLTIRAVVADRDTQNVKRGDVGLEIRNTGGTRAEFPVGKSYYRLQFADGTTRDSRPVSGKPFVLAPGRKYLEWLDMASLPKSGGANVTVQVDPYEIVPELTERNNTHRFSLATAHTGSGRTAKRDGLADLTIKNVTIVPPKPALNNFRKVILRIQNEGDAPARFARDTEQIGLRVNGGELVTVPTGRAERTLAPKEHAAITLSPELFAAAGDYEVVAVVDPTDAVKEREEGNNKHRFRFTVDESVLPDLIVSRVVTVPEKPQAGTGFVFEITVTNRGDSRGIVADGPTLDFAGRPIFGSIHLAPGAEKKFTLKASGAETAPGKRTSYAWVDPGNQQIETNEENNGLAFTYEVLE